MVFYRMRADSEQGGDLSIRFSVMAAEGEDLQLLRRQFFEQRLPPADLFGFFHPVFRLDGGGLRHTDRGERLFFCREPAKKRIHPVFGDRFYPGAEVLHMSQLAPFFPYLYKHFLRNLFSHDIGVRQAEGKSIYRRMISIEDLPERRFIALRYFQEQRFFII